MEIGFLYDLAIFGVYIRTMKRELHAPLLLSPAEVAATLRVSHQTIRSLRLVP